jgi:hypothetical protein
VDCPPTTPGEPVWIPDGGVAAPNSYLECIQNEDCTEGTNGRCEGNGHDGWRCAYDMCSNDAACTGGVCACNGASRGTTNVCLAGNCRLDSACGGNGYCSPTLGSCGHYDKASAYYCHTPEDECVNDDDCGGGSGGAYCAYEPAVGHWKCSTSECEG